MNNATSQTLRNKQAIAEARAALIASPEFQALEKLHTEAARSTSWHATHDFALGGGKSLRVTAHAGSTQTPASWFLGERDTARERGVCPCAPFSFRVIGADGDEDHAKTLSVSEDKDLIRATIAYALGL